MLGTGTILESLDTYRADGGKIPNGFGRIQSGGHLRSASEGTWLCRDWTHSFSGSEDSRCPDPRKAFVRYAFDSYLGKS